MKRILQIPISGLYTLGVAIRHWLYDRRLLPSLTVGVPTICVGNLAVGGTGKTPMVEYIVRRLTAEGIRVAVLSRGYKRKTRGFILADEKATARTIGDEAMQIHTRFPDVPVAVCEGRVRGIHRLLRLVDNLDVVVLDDAFQHRSLRCGLTILLTPCDRLYIDDHMLPWGTLRDLPSRALKADVIVVTKCPADMQPIDMRVLDNRLHLPAFQHLYFSDFAYGNIAEAGVPLVVCGIARPDYLMAHVQSVCPKAELMAFNDHHAYTKSDIKAILKRVQPFDYVLTTEKDLQRMRLTDMEQRLAEQGKKLVALPVSVRVLNDAEGLDRNILTYVREHRRKNV